MQQIIERIVLEESHESSSPTSATGGPLHSRELDDLTLYCQSDGFEGVENDPLSTIVQALVQHVTAAVAKAGQLTEAAASVLHDHDAPSAAAQAIDKVR